MFELKSKKGFIESLILLITTILLVLYCVLFRAKVETIIVSICGIVYMIMFFMIKKGKSKILILGIMISIIMVMVITLNDKASILPYM